MSKISLSGNPSGTGTFTIASPNSNTDRTVNLPDAGGTVIVGTQPAGDIVGTTATQTLTNKSIATTQLTGRVPAANAPSGSVIQVINDFRAVTRLATTSTSFVNTDITASITPSSTSSRILILISTSANNEAGGRNIFFEMTRNGTRLADVSEGMCSYLNVGSSRAEVPVTISHLDSPNSTSAVTYTLQVRSGTGSTIEVPHGTNIRSSIILMEIAG